MVTILKRKRARALRAYRDDDVAYAMGIWAMAAIFDNQKAAAWCAKNGLLLTRAAGEGTNSAGGALVPVEMEQSIINLSEIYGAFRGSAEIVRMARDSLTWPRLTGNLTAYFTAENAALTESQLAFDNIWLVAKKLATLTRISSEVSEDAAIDFAELLAGQIAYAFALKEDQCGFLGDGSSTYGGITGVTVGLLQASHSASKVTAAVGHNTFATLDTTDLANLIAALLAVALPKAKWFCSQYAFGALFCRLASVAGGIIMQQDEITGQTVPTFLGFEIVLTQVLPQVGTSLTGQIMILFGNLELAAALGDRRVVTVAQSDQRFLDSDQIAIRGTERIDINVHDLGSSSVGGPIVGLVAP